MAAMMICSVVAAAVTAVPAAASGSSARTGATPALAADGESSVSYGAGDLESLTPARVLDTRQGIGAPVAQVGAGGRLRVQVTGVGGVPSIGVGAVVLNLTGIAPTSPTYVTAWPAGAPRPVASSVNLRAGEVRPNLVIVKVGRDGMIDLYNNSGRLDLAADVSGWFPEASGLQPLVPSRILDTRSGVGAPKAKVASGATLGVQVAGRGGVPGEGVGAVVVNLTGISPTSTTYLTAWPSDVARPLASNLNLRPGDVAANLAVVKVGGDGRMQLFNSSGQLDVAADVVGWFPLDSAYEPVTPDRILDTRTGVGAPVGPVGAASTLTLDVTGRGGVPAEGVGAVVLNLTGIAPSAASTYVTASPSGTPRPVASNLNLTRGVVVANLVVARVGSGGRIDLFNLAGTTHLAADVVGWFPDGGGAATAITPAPGTVLTGPGDLVSVTGDADSGGTATFSSSADLPEVGEHFAAAGGLGAGPGVSGVVTSRSDHPDASATVTFAPADLQDVFTDLEISTGPDAVVAPAAVGPAGPFGAANSSAGRVGAAAVECSVDGAPVSEPTIGFGEFTGSADYSLRGRSARIEMGGTLRIGWSASVSGAVACDVDLAGGPLGWIGPVEVGWGVGTSFSISGEVTAQASLEVPINVGFDYDDGEATNLSSADLVGDVDGDATAELAAGFEASISAKLFGVLGFDVSVVPTLTMSLTIDPEEPTVVCATMEASIVVGIGAELEKWGVGWDFDIGESTLAERTVYTSPGCGPTQWSGTMSFTDSIAFECVDVEICAVDSWTNEVDGSLTLISTPTPDGTFSEQYLSTVDLTSVFVEHDSLELGADPDPCTLNFELTSTYTLPGVTRMGLELIRLEGGAWSFQAGFQGAVEPIEDLGETGSGSLDATSRAFGCGEDSTSVPPGAPEYAYFPQLNDQPDSEPVVLVDTDPDPDRLVGTTTRSFTAPDRYPGLAGTETMVLTYDFRRVPVD